MLDFAQWVYRIRHAVVENNQLARSMPAKVISWFG
jgi:hypothetical protein